ncbi:serine threonine kinase [Tubulinosema ratisbonensis]|uniref:mitogen-activated protein kinase kinase n=1 Tax=Tubulinosema ratisbonensis TaxID=291195 RepID=A0A437AMZ2_9MICR|nr:serine threonine kinase [Tubulinosema ratisbonensis]
MLYNEHNQPSTPYKKIHRKKSTGKLVIVPGESYEPECLVNRGSYFDCYIGVKHKKECKIDHKSKLNNFDEFIKEKLTKFVPVKDKEILTKIGENFINYKCIKINKEIQQCINCKKEVCIECVKQCKIESNGCKAMCVLVSRRNICTDFIEIIKKVHNLEGNLVKISYASFTDDQFILQMPYHILSLQDILIYANSNKLKLKKEFIYKIMLDCAKGVLQLNQVNLIHNDIKPQNILFNLEKEVFLLCDFNVSQEPGIIKLDGDKKYMGKEILNDLCFFVSDVYSLGVLYLEMSDKKSDVFISRMISDEIKNRPSIKEVISYFTL